jgi:hypothetical protein
LVRRIYFFVALITILMGIGLPAVAQSGRTFYIDYAGGSNSNNGLSQGAPWKTHPYMQDSAACSGTGSAPAYTHATGDRFIFKGGAVWPAACFGMNVSQGGTSSANDYYGVDLSWFSGSSFSRPVFNLNGQLPTAAGPLGGRNVIWVDGQYVTFDNLEIKGQFIQGGHSGPDVGYDCGIYFSTNVAGSTVKNGYFHDWISNAAGLNAGFSNCAGGIAGHSTFVDSMEISDQAGQPVPFGSCFANMMEVKNSKCHHVAQGLNGYASVHDSEFANISDQSTISPYTNGIHTNVIQQTWPGGAGAVYNNVIHDNKLGQVVGMCPSTNFYNNVMWGNSGAGADILVDTGVNACNVNTGTVANIYNNTVDCSNGVSCLRVIRSGQTIGTVNVKNNHWITSGSPVSIELTITSMNQGNNITMNPSSASSQGYTIANQFMPTSSSSPTVNAAVNLSGLCGGNLGAFCSDRLHVQRLTSWDVGAYVFNGQSSAKPPAPTNLVANVQ